MKLGIAGGVLVVLAVIAAIVGYSSLFTVYQTRLALVVRLGQPVGIIDERIAKLMWPGESAIGKRYRVAPQLMKTPWFEIVGVVGHIRHDALDVDAHTQAYWPAAQATACDRRS